MRGGSGHLRGPDASGPPRLRPRLEQHRARAAPPSPRTAKRLRGRTSRRQPQDRRGTVIHHGQRAQKQVRRDYAYDIGMTSVVSRCYHGVTTDFISSFTSRI